MEEQARIVAKVVDREDELITSMTLASTTPTRGTRNTPHHPSSRVSKNDGRPVTSSTTPVPVPKQKSSKASSVSSSSKLIVIIPPSQLAARCCLVDRRGQTGECRPGAQNIESCKIAFYTLPSTNAAAAGNVIREAKTHFRTHLRISQTTTGFRMLF